MSVKFTERQIDIILDGEPDEIPSWFAKKYPDMNPGPLMDDPTYSENMTDVEWCAEVGRRTSAINAQWDGIAGFYKMQSFRVRTAVEVAEFERIVEEIRARTDGYTTEDIDFSTWDL